MSDLTLEERVKALEAIASGSSERVQKLENLDRKGALIMDTLGHVVNMIEDLQVQIGDCNDGVLTKNYQQANT